MAEKTSPIEKAILETGKAIATVKADTRKRKKWTVIGTETLLNWAKESGIGETLTVETLAIRWARETYSHIPDNAPVRIKPAANGEQELIAIWSDKDEEIDCEPEGF